MGAGLYIHIPYCIRKCAYCDFVSYQDRGRMGAYLAALQEEMCLYEDACRDVMFDTVFVGGGTPSLLDAGEMQALLSALREHFTIARDAEVTVEANPGTLNREKLTGFLCAGANRLSIGIQSLDDGILRAIGRIHTAQEARQAVSLASETGFSNINVDLMHGLPGQTVETYLATLEEASSMPGVTHVSAYSLILEEGTPLARSVAQGAVSLPGEDETADMQDAGIALLAEKGFDRYEISNFAKPGFTCRHNVNYWENGMYLGLGVAAHSAFRLGGRWLRWSNPEDPETYFARIDREIRPSAEPQVIGPEEEQFETVMLGLRMTDGISLSGFRARHGRFLSESYPESVRALMECGWARETEDRFMLTGKGLDFQNAALVCFLEESGLKMG